MTNPRATSPSARAARALPWLVAFSGAAALVYQSLWLRSFGLIFGSTTGAVALVLAVFMGGLAAGSALAARRPASRPLLAYARLELAAGAAALVTLPLLRALPAAYGALVGSLPAPVEAFGRALLAALVLLPPTLLLGATMPLALAFLERAGVEVRGGFGRLYLLNTLGGAFGVALGAFVLLPALGVRLTFVIAAATSLMVGGLALRWAREIVESPAPPAAAATAAATAAAPGPGPAGWLLPALASASGAATFGAEVLWTRSLALVIGSSFYAFNLMLLAVLLGIAAGTLVYARLRESIARPARAAGLLFVAAGLALLLGQLLIGQLPSLWLALVARLPVSFGAHQAGGFALGLLALLPVTVLLGLGFPLLLHLARSFPGSAQADSGRLYAWNTAGAIAGALAAHVVLVPRLGLQGPYVVFAGLLLVGGAWALARERGLRPAWTAALAGALAIAIAALAPRWRPWDPVVMSSGVHRYALEWRDRPRTTSLGAWLRESRTLVFYREGEEAVVAVSEPKAGGRRFLSVNGKTDAGSGTEDVVTQKFIAHVPLLLHTGPRRVLVVGWGAGATAASAALHRIESLECVELERATFEAAPFFEPLSGGVRRDPRFRVAFADGRNHLLRAREPWDVVISEPSNPWISGVSNLFTREFYETVLARLGPAGVFGQWFHYYNLEPEDVMVEARTFAAVFPHVSLWLVPPTTRPDGSRQLGADLLLVGSRERQVLDWPRLERAFADGPLAEDLRATGVLRDPAALASAWAMGREEIERWTASARSRPLNTDDYPYVELVAPRRLVIAPAAAAAAAAMQYQSLARGAGDVTRVLAGQPMLAAGGALAAPFLDRLGERYAQAAQPERAIATYTAALRADPQDAVAHSRAGELLLERGRSADAFPRLREAVRLDPHRPRAWEGLGQIALERRDYPAAEQAQRELLRLEPANVTGWLRLGAALARQQQWAEARDALRTARSIDPQAPIDRDLLAYVVAQAGDLGPP